ncbi:hypothetical protein SAMN05877809_10729 [Rhodobacter sp. JA431]|uniref:hypothetical protein n=1 Tax=Rhodobacter sp. JA431 TaxID=570013 RepID=UPI000BC922A5|nr:hypothetical protein [Rhodobacter sp. JA431]SOC13869.1 hypothetical protein SAMN05877809_10729 [Rhodobacter sp. JA431]
MLDAAIGIALVTLGALGLAFIFHFAEAAEEEETNGLGIDIAATILPILYASSAIICVGVALAFNLI